LIRISLQHNTANLIALPSSGKGSVHLKVVEGYLGSIRPQITGSNTMTVRKWLNEKSFEFQYEFGLEVLRNNGIPVP